MVTVAELHAALTEGTLRDRGGASTREPMFGAGHYFGGLDRVGEHWLQVRRRGQPQSTETKPAREQAALWFEDVRREVPQSARAVARQLARLCGDDSKVTISQRSLADAVGQADKAGRQRAFTERGVEALIQAGWLRVEVVGRGRGSKTTYFLIPG